MRHLCLYVLAPLLLLALVAPTRAEKVERLKPAGYVNDFAGILDEQTKTQLKTLCTEIDQKTGAQIAVVTINSLEGVKAADFGNRLFNQWGVGHKADNRGLLILLAISDRKYRVEVGYGLEPILPNRKVGAFGREMVPILRKGDYNRAILQLTNSIARVIASDRGTTLDTLPGSPAR
jgi:uncharacterized protein